KARRRTGKFIFDCTPAPGRLWAIKMGRRNGCDRTEIPSGARPGSPGAVSLEVSEGSELGRARGDLDVVRGELLGVAVAARVRDPVGALPRGLHRPGEVGPEAGVADGGLDPHGHAGGGGDLFDELEKAGDVREGPVIVRADAVLARPHAADPRDLLGDLVARQ